MVSSLLTMPLLKVGQSWTQMDEVNQVAVCGPKVKLTRYLPGAQTVQTGEAVEAEVKV
jgi:hypothetical protein